MPPGLTGPSDQAAYFGCADGFGGDRLGYPKKLPSSNFPAGLFCNLQNLKRVTRVLEKLPVPGYQARRESSDLAIEWNRLANVIADLTHLLLIPFRPWGFCC